MPEQASCNSKFIGLTIEQLRRIMPNARPDVLQKYLDPLNAAMQEFEINTPLRQAAFLAQVAVETGEFGAKVPEGFQNQSPEGMTEFGVKNKYKGRGLIHLTSQTNYKAVSEGLGLGDKLVKNPNLVADDPVLAARTAGYFFENFPSLKPSKNPGKLNKLADNGDFLGIALGVNGRNKETGLPNGWKERQGYYKTSKPILSTREVLLTPTYLGDSGDSGVFRVNLAESGLCFVQSITIQDDNLISGGTGAVSGFDLDMIRLSSTLVSGSSQVASIPGLGNFNFSPSGTFFEAGTLQTWDQSDPPEWNRNQLFGTNGAAVNFSGVTFDQLDGSNDAEGDAISIGEGGQITFVLTAPLPTENLYLYLADVGGGNDGVRVKLSEGNMFNPRQGLNIQGTTGDDIIDVNQGVNQNVGQGDDLIRGGDGNDRVSSGKGRDTVYGDAQDDVIDGGIGNNTLFGGAGRDTFVLNKGAGRSAIKDFNPREDFIGLTNSTGYKNLTIRQKGSNVVISVGGDQLGVLNNIRAGQLTAANFVNF